MEEMPTGAEHCRELALSLLGFPSRALSGKRLTQIEPAGEGKRWLEIPHITSTAQKGVGEAGIWSLNNQPRELTFLLGVLFYY